MCAITKLIDLFPERSISPERGSITHYAKTVHCAITPPKIGHYGITPTNAVVYTPTNAVVYTPTRDIFFVNLAVTFLTVVK